MDEQRLKLWNWVQYPRLDSAGNTQTEKQEFPEPTKKVRRPRHRSGS